MKRSCMLLALFVCLVKYKSTDEHSLPHSQHVVKGRHIRADFKHYKQPSLSLFDLLARDSMLSALYAIANPSVCLSVCHTGGSVENG